MRLSLVLPSWTSLIAFLWISENPSGFNVLFLWGIYVSLYWKEGNKINCAMYRCGPESLILWERTRFTREIPSDGSLWRQTPSCTCTELARPQSSVRQTGAAQTMTEFLSPPQMNVELSLRFLSLWPQLTSQPTTSVLLSLITRWWVSRQLWNRGDLFPGRKLMMRSSFPIWRTCWSAFALM